MSSGPAKAVAARHLGKRRERTRAQRDAHAEAERKRRRLQKTSALLTNDSRHNHESAEARLRSQLAAATARIAALEAQAAAAVAVLGGQPPARPRRAAAKSHIFEATSNDGDADWIDFGFGLQGIMATYNYWTLTDERCLTATKLTKLQLDTEAAFFKPYMEGTTYTGQQRKKKSHLETNVPTHVHFFIYLLYCNHYPRLYFAAWALKMPEADLHKSLKRTSAAIARAARDTNLSLGVHGRPTLPTAAELAAIKEKQKGMKNKGLETAEFVVDGEFHPHPAPSIGSDHDDLRKSLWRAKYNAFGQMIIKVTTLTGIVIYCSPLSTRSEQTLLRESGVLDYCRKTGSGIVTDGGYVVNVRGTKESDLVDAFFTLGPTGIGSARALAAAEGAPGDVREEARRILVSSSMASQMRLVVENRNALECTWAVLSQPFRPALHSGVYSLNLSDVELGLVFIDNRRLLFHKELRAAVWKPKALTTRPDATYWYPGNRQSAQSVARWLAK
jgi:hypothetical protein